MTGTGSAAGATGFTKPPVFGVRTTVPGAVVVIVVAIAWVSATMGRLHPILVALVPVAVLLVSFATIYHVAVTHWIARWWAWLRRRRAVTRSRAATATDVIITGLPIGVISENEALITLIELHSDPLAPTVVTATEERTVNVLNITELAQLVTQVLDVKVASADLISCGYRAAGGFADLYQQMTGPTVGAADRRSWIVVRIGLHDNLAAIDRRGGDTDAAQRVAAVTCLRVADTLASAGIDARPAPAEAIDAANAQLHTEVPTADHWSHLESRNGYTGVYYADPAHIAEDAAQWWTWPLSQDITTLVRLTPTGGDEVDIAALVRYRTEARPPSPPVSRLGPLYGVQASMWQQFRVGYLPCEAPLPSAPLAAEPVVAFGPAGPLIGSIGDPRDHTAVHLPLAGPITVLCQGSALLRQVALRTCATGRPIVVVTDEPHKWQSIVALAVSGAVSTNYPASWNPVDDADSDRDAETPAPGSAAQPPAHVETTLEAGLAPETVLVIDTDEEWPQQLPQVTVLTDDEACDADIELIDPDDQFGFTLKTRTGLSARLRSIPAHEERRILGAGPKPTPKRVSAAPRRSAPAASAPSRPARFAARPASPRSPQATTSPAASATSADAADAMPGTPAPARPGPPTPAAEPPDASERPKTSLPQTTARPRPQPRSGSQSAAAPGPPTTRRVPPRPAGDTPPTPKRPAPSPPQPEPAPRTPNRRRFWPFGRGREPSPPLPGQRRKSQWPPPARPEQSNGNGRHRIPEEQPKSPIPPERYITGTARWQRPPPRPSGPAGDGVPRPEPSATPESPDTPAAPHRGGEDR